MAVFDKPTTGGVSSITVRKGRREAGVHYVFRVSPRCVVFEVFRSGYTMRTKCAISDAFVRDSVFA